ncbi:MAG: Maf family protein [bacterium]|nr:Maf family protein [bacterium]
MATKLILASQSIQRQNLLKTVGVPFTVVPSDIDEKAIRHDDLAEQARLIAQAKAAAVQLQFPEAAILAADTFAECEGRVMEKPASVDEARGMLEHFSDTVFIVFSGFYFSDPSSGVVISKTVLNKAKFRPLSKEEIVTYVSTQPVTTWSGAFSAAYSEGASLIEWIEGSLTAFTHGLPMEEVYSALRKASFLPEGVTKKHV